MCAEPTNSRVETETLGMESFSLIRSQIASEERPNKPEYILSPPPRAPYGLMNKVVGPNMEDGKE